MKARKSGLLSVVIPAYAEEKGIHNLLQRLSTILQEVGPHEIIIVDDGSPDHTWQVLEEAVLQIPRLRALQLSRNFGKEAAIAAGVEAARGDAVLVMDADLQHPPELIPEMYRMWAEGAADVIEAVKSDRSGQPWLTRLRAKAFYRILSGLSGQNLDGASDFKLMDRKVVDAWLRMDDHALFFRGMISWLGFHRAQLSFVVPERQNGRSKWTTWKLFRLAANAISSFSSAPLQLVTLAGAIFMVFSLLLGVQTVATKIAGEAVDGFTTVILLLLIIGSLLMFSLGIIGSYIARIFDEVKGRPRFVMARELASLSEPNLLTSASPDKHIDSQP